MLPASLGMDRAALSSAVGHDAQVLTIKDVEEEAAGKRHPATVHALGPPVVRELLLRASSISEEAVAVLCAALRSNLQLQSLHIFCPGLGSFGAEALSYSLYSNRHVRCLGLQHCGLGDVGCIALSGLLCARSCCLEWLSLRGNNLRPKSLRTLAVAVGSNHSLLSLDLGENSPDFGAIGELTESLMITAVLRSINLQACELNDADVERLAQCFVRNNVLSVVELDGNPDVSEAGMWFMAQALDANDLVDTVHVNRVEEYGLDAF
jgi:hypothetical protein